MALGNLITAGSGNDSISLDGSIATLRTSSGSSTVAVGANYTIDVGDGSDFVLNYIEYAIIRGGDGNDSIENGESNVSIDGGTGDDTIHNEANTYNVSIYGGAGNDTIDNLHGHYATINSGSGNDFVWNSGISARIDTGAGNDSVENWGSHVSIYGGDGKNFINNLAGDYAVIYGGTGEDSIRNSNHGSYVSIYGGEGNDIINSRSAHTNVYGDAGNDRLSNSGSYSSVDGGDGNDFIINQDAYSNIYGGDGNDTIENINRGSYVSIDGGDGNDSIYNDYWGAYANIDGGAGDDSILNHGSYSTVYGGDGNDSIVNIGAYTSIDGGAWIDTIYGYEYKYRPETFIHTADTDIIYGFGSEDILSIRSGQVTSSIESGSDLILVTSNNGSIILKNVSSDIVQIGENVLEGSSIDSLEGSSTYISIGSSTDVSVGSSGSLIDTSVEFFTDTLLGSSTYISEGSSINFENGSDEIEIIEWGSDSSMSVDNIDSVDSSDGMTRRTIIRPISDGEAISVQSVFRTDDIQFAFYGSDGNIHTSANRSDESRAFVDMHAPNRANVVASNVPDDQSYYAGSNLTLDTSSNMMTDQASWDYEDISSGNITISNGDGSDVFDFANYTIDEISTQFPDLGLILSTNENSSLNLTSESSYSIANTPQDLF